MRAGPKREITAPPLDLSGLPASGVARVDAFAREYLRVPKGKGAREPFRLRPWQRDIVRSLLPARGARPRQALVSMPRGNGKTALASVLAAYGLYADGVEGAQVLVVASDERQAGHVLRAVRRMVELEPRLAEVTQVYTDRLYVPATDSELRTLPAEPGALQGWDPSMLIVDELHVVTDATWEAVTTAAGKRQSSLTLAISTPAESPESVMGRLVEHGRTGTDPSFVFVEYAAPAGCAVDDRAAWKVANPALGDFLYADALVALLPPKTREPAYRRYRLGQWTTDLDGAWLPPGAWAACAAPGQVADGTEVVLSLDGSFSGDATALVVATVSPRPHLDVAGLWESAGDPVYRVPVADVEARIRDCARRWQVREVVADPYRWTRTLQALEAEGLPMVEHPQSPQRMTPATTGLYEAVVNREVTHSGDRDLARHVGNATVKDDARGTRLAKTDRNSVRRIDLAVSAVMAHARATHHARQTKPKGRVISW